MFNFVYSIPSAIGWHIFGVVAIACVVMAVKLVKLCIEIWREWHTETEAEQ